jgi:Asp/Glu/hydantoin racemase
MRILLINPNTSVDMTERIAAQARLHAQPGTEIVAATAEFGCEVVASRASYAIAAHAALDAYARHGAGFDAVLLACFGDPGLEALRELATVPVIGMLESAAEKAARHPGGFAIITAGPAWVGMLQERMRLSAHAAGLRDVYAIDTTGLQVSRDPLAATAPLQAALDRAIADGAAAVVLGGSALAGFGARLRSRVELIDPLQVAVAAAEQRLVEVLPHGPHPAQGSKNLGVALQTLLDFG